MLALSIRQPWAWLILNAGKDIENRSWPTRFRGRFLVHASKGMTQDEYHSALWFFRSCGHNPDDVPVFEKLERGGIVGAIDIVDCVGRSDSPWFVGDYGFVLRNPEILPFRAYRGALGFFEVHQPEQTDPLSRLTCG
jgi:hypothetical protein